jgi:hypothetical protein
MSVRGRGADGRFVLSPKGDPPGFVAVLDEKNLFHALYPAPTPATLAIPDRLGNNLLGKAPAWTGRLGLSLPFLSQAGQNGNDR